MPNKPKLIKPDSSGKFTKSPSGDLGGKKLETNSRAEKAKDY